VKTLFFITPYKIYFHSLPAKAKRQDANQMSPQITRRRSGSYFAQLIIIACILCASSINATPLPIASPSLGLSNQNSYLQPVSHLSKRMELAGMAGVIATGQAAHNAAAAREGATGKSTPSHIILTQDYAGRLSFLLQMMPTF
jgi:hypothetical protein